VSIETIEKLVQVGLVIRAAARVDTSLTWPNLREFLSAQDWKTITADVVDKMARDEVEDSVPGSIAPEWCARSKPFESGGEVKKRRLGLNSGGCKTEDGITGTEAVAEVGKEAGVETSAHFHGYGRSWYQRWQEEDQRSWEDGREARLDSHRGLWERKWAQAVEQAASSKEQPEPAEGSAGGKKKAKVEVKEEVHAVEVDDGEGTELGEIDMDQIEVLWPKGTTWAATHHKAHFCNYPELPPWCLQRKAKRAKPLRRVIAAGESIDLLRSLEIPVCLECCKVLISVV
jgi:hypothetical protein